MKVRTCACNKASKVMGMIKRTTKYKKAGIMVSLYKTLVGPHVKYYVTAWSPYYKEDGQLLKKVQRRFTKIIVSIEGLSYEERLRCLKLWTVKERRNKHDLIEVFNISQGKSIIGLQDLFTLDKNKRGTRR